MTAAWKEPYPGWVEGLNGPTGLMIGGARGNSSWFLHKLKKTENSRIIFTLWIIWFLAFKSSNAQVSYAQCIAILTFQVKIPIYCFELLFVRCNYFQIFSEYPNLSSYSNLADIVPVDVCMNAIITAAWERGIAHDCKDVQFRNIVSVKSKNYYRTKIYRAFAL